MRFTVKDTKSRRREKRVPFFSPSLKSPMCIPCSLDLCAGLWAKALLSHCMLISLCRVTHTSVYSCLDRTATLSEHVALHNGFAKQACLPCLLRTGFRGRVWRRACLRNSPTTYCWRASGTAATDTI